MMSRFAIRFKHRQHTENITDDDEFPIHLFNYPWCYRMTFGANMKEQVLTGKVGQQITPKTDHILTE